MFHLFSVFADKNVEHNELNLFFIFSVFFWFIVALSNIKLRLVYSFFLIQSVIAVFNSFPIVIYKNLYKNILFFKYIFSCKKTENK